MPSDAVIERLLPWAATLLLLALWEGAALGGLAPSAVLPAPHEIASVIGARAGEIAGHAAQTMATSLAGLALAIVVGVALGVAIGAAPLIHQALYPALVAFNAVPKVAIVPILVIWFGLGTVPALLSAFLVAFFPIVVNVAAGLAAVPPELRDVLRALGASRAQIVWKVGLPSALPHLFAALKIAATLAFVGSVLSETVAANRGMGALMKSAEAAFDVPMVFAALVVVGAMGVALHAAFALLERRMTKWAPRAEAPQAAGG